MVLQCSAVPYCSTFGKLFSRNCPWRLGQKHTSAACSVEATSKGPTMTCLMSRIRKQNASASAVFADAQEMMTQLIILAKVMKMEPCGTKFFPTRRKLAAPCIHKQLLIHVVGHGVNLLWHGAGVVLPPSLFKVFQTCRVSPSCVHDLWTLYSPPW